MTIMKYAKMEEMKGCTKSRLGEEIEVDYTMPLN